MENYIVFNPIIEIAHINITKNYEKIRSKGWKIHKLNIIQGFRIY